MGGMNGSRKIEGRKGRGVVEGRRDTLLRRDIECHHFI